MRSTYSNVKKSRRFEPRVFFDLNNNDFRGFYIGGKVKKKKNKNNLNPKYVYT